VFDAKARDFAMERALAILNGLRGGRAPHDTRRGRSPVASSRGSQR
jgi:hypothetical protein